LGRANRAYRFGQIALALLERLNAKAWMPRTKFVVNGLINVWSHPLWQLVDLLASAHLDALQTGDIEASVLCASTHLVTAFQAGKALAELEEVARAYCEKMDALGQ
jgi:predicted ATPase